MLKSLEQIRSELNVSNFVSMNEQKIICRDQSVATFALCGCTCFAAISQIEVFLSHYDPCSINTQILGFKNWSQNKLFELHIFASGEWIKDAQKWVMQPKQHFGIDNAIIKCYSESIDIQESLFSRSVVWDGKRLISGLVTY